MIFFQRIGGPILAYRLGELDAAEGLDADLGDDLLVGDDGKIGELPFDELAHEAANVC